MLGFLATLAIIKVYSVQLKNSLTHKHRLLRSCLVQWLSFLITYPNFSNYDILTP